MSCTRDSVRLNNHPLRARNFPATSLYLTCLRTVPHCPSKSRSASWPVGDAVLPFQTPVPLFLHHSNDLIQCCREKDLTKRCIELVPFVEIPTSCEYYFTIIRGPHDGDTFPKFVANANPIPPAIFWMTFLVLEMLTPQVFLILGYLRSAICTSLSAIESGSFILVQFATSGSTACIGH